MSFLSKFNLGLDLPSRGVTGLIVYFSEFHTLRGEVWKIHCQTCHTLWGKVWQCIFQTFTPGGSVNKNLKSPIFILQRAYIPKNGVEFRQQFNGDNRSGVATLYDLMRRRQNTLVRTQSQLQPLDPRELQSNDRAKNEVAFCQLFNGAKRISLARLYNVQQCHLISRL